MLIRTSKTDKDSTGELVPVKRGRHPETDPVAIVDDWLAALPRATSPRARCCARSPARRFAPGRRDERRRRQRTGPDARRPRPGSRARNTSPHTACARDPRPPPPNTAPRSRRSPSRAAGRPPLRWSTATSAPPTAGTSTPTSGCAEPTRRSPQGAGAWPVRTGGEVRLCRPVPEHVRRASRRAPWRCRRTARSARWPAADGEVVGGADVDVFAGGFVAGGVAGQDHDVLAVDDVGVVVGGPVVPVGAELLHDAAGDALGGAVGAGQGESGHLGPLHVVGQGGPQGFEVAGR